MTRLRQTLGNRSVRESEVAMSSICSLKTTRDKILISQLPPSSNLNKIRILKLLYSRARLLTLLRLLALPRLLPQTRQQVQTRLQVQIRRPQPLHSPKKAAARILSTAPLDLVNANQMTSQPKSKSLWTRCAIAHHNLLLTIQILDLHPKKVSSGQRSQRVSHSAIQTSTKSHGGTSISMIRETRASRQEKRLIVAPSITTVKHTTKIPKEHSKVPK